MKTKNKKIYNADLARLREVAEEYEYIGFDVKISGNTLTVFSQRRKADKKDKDRKWSWQD